MDEEDQLINLINNKDYSSYYEKDQNFQEQCNIEYLSCHQMAFHFIKAIVNSQVEIFPSKTLNINNKLKEFQKRKLIKMLQKHYSAYAWEYIDMKGINSKTCMHHIYIQENVKLVRQP